MPSRTDTAGHTKAFIYPVMNQSSRYDQLKSEDQLYPGINNIILNWGRVFQDSPRHV